MRLWWGCGEILREEPSRLKMELFFTFWDSTWSVRLWIWKCLAVILAGGVEVCTAFLQTSDLPGHHRHFAPLIWSLQFQSCSKPMGVGRNWTLQFAFSPRNDTEHLSLQNHNLFLHPPMFLPCFTNFFTHILADLHPKQIQDPRLSCRLHPPRQLGGCRPGSRWGAGGGRARAHRGAPEAAASELSHGRPGEVPWGPVAGGDGDGKRRMSLDLKTLVLMGCYIEKSINNIRQQFH